MRKLTNIIITAVIITTAVLVAILFDLSNTGLPDINNDEILSFNDGWTYSIDGGEFLACDSPTDLTGQPANSIILKNVVPDDIDDNFESLYFINSRNFIEISVNQNVVYVLDETKLSTIGEAPGVLPLIVELGDIQKDDEITVEMRPAYGKAEVDSFYLTEKSNALFHMLNREFISFVLSAFMVMLGVGEVVFYIFISNKKQATHMLHLGFFTAVTGFYTFTTLPMIGMFLREPYIYSVASYLLLYLMPIPILFFVCTAYKLKHDQHLYVLMYMHIALWLVVIVLQSYNIVDVRMSLSYFHMLIGLSLFVLAVTAVYEIFIQKNAKIREFGVSALVLCIFSAIDMFTYYTNNEAYRSTFLRIGVIGFSGILLAEFLRELSESVKEKERTKLYEKLAFEDILTSTKNRTCFERDFEQIKSQPELLNKLSLGMFDINGLKQINDNLGHKQGDILIQSAATSLKTAFSEAANVYRMGGDEFSLISTDITQKDIPDLMKNLEQKIEEINETLEFKLSIAGRICVYDDQQDNNPDDLLKRVDQEMYDRKAKMKGLKR